MLEELQFTEASEPTYEVSLGRQEIPLYILWQRLQRHVRSEATYQDTHRGAALQVQSLRKIIHPKMLTRISLP